VDQSARSLALEERNMLLSLFPLTPPLRHVLHVSLSLSMQIEKVDGFTVGQQLQAEALFKPGDLVDVQGTSVGKGFQGGTKRYGFARGLMTHGSKSHRAPGAIGGNTAGRVYAFQRMPGRMGGTTVKVRKLEVIRVTNDCILVKGSVPGKPGHILRVTPAKIVGKNLTQL
jgi:large subunit ribosomal protein L3